jgi:multisubunit Na+/H+ antiporter MnhG subunit
MRVRWERIRKLRAREFVYPLNMEPNFCLVFSTWCEFLQSCAKFRLHPDDCRVKTGFWKLSISENCSVLYLGEYLFCFWFSFWHESSVLFCLFVFAIVVVAWPVLAHEIFFNSSLFVCQNLSGEVSEDLLQWPAHLPVMCSLLLGSFFSFFGVIGLWWHVWFCFCERVIRLSFQQEACVLIWRNESMSFV